jgi:hypothetical protein
LAAVAAVGAKHENGVAKMKNEGLRSFLSFRGSDELLGTREQNPLWKNQTPPKGATGRLN